MTSSKGCLFVVHCTRSPGDNMSCLHRSDCYVTLAFAHSRASATSILKSDEISHWNFLADNQSVVTINPLCCNNFLPFDNLPWRMEEGQARSSAGSGQRPKSIRWCIQDLLLCAAGCCPFLKKSWYWRCCALLGKVYIVLSLHCSECCTRGIGNLGS